MIISPEPRTEHLNTALIHILSSTDMQFFSHFVFSPWNFFSSLNARISFIIDIPARFSEFTATNVRFEPGALEFCDPN